MLLRHQTGPAVAHPAAAGRSGAPPRLGPTPALTVSVAPLRPRTSHRPARTWPGPAGVALTALMAVAVAGLLFFAVGPRLLPYRTVTMLSGSMRPGIPTGAVVVDVAEPLAALRPGQVISFEAPVAGHPVVTHRVVEVHRWRGQTVVRTKGDANPGADPWLAVVHGRRVWRARFVLRGTGALIRLLRRPSVHLAVAWLAPAALLGWLLVGLWRRPAPAPEP